MGILVVTFLAWLSSLLRLWLNRSFKLKSFPVYYINLLQVSIVPSSLQLLLCQKGMLHHEKKVCEWLLISLGGILLASRRNCQCLLSASQAKMMLLMIQLFLCFLLFLLIKGKNIQIGPKTNKQTKEIQTMITVSYFNNIPTLSLLL